VFSQPIKAGSDEIFNLVCENHGDSKYGMKDSQGCISILVLYNQTILPEAFFLRKVDCQMPNAKCQMPNHLMWPDASETNNPRSRLRRTQKDTGVRAHKLQIACHVGTTEERIFQFYIGKSKKNCHRHPREATYVVNVLTERY
jgi:hypothetical protein